MKLFIGFAAFGLGLAAFGVYGVVAHSVAERRRELGVRIALGATDRDILHAVLRETVVIGLAGIAVGLFVTKYGVQSLGTFALDEIYNAPLFAGAAAFLFLIAAASAFIPALRATRVDPTESLRNE
jgi:ABC-type antimicrobial peptide transport system permease subunit